MRTFLLEDDHQRIAWFKENIPGIEVHENATEECKEALRTNKYDIIFLDHDLGGRVYVPSEESNTGYQVAKELALPGINRDTLVIIHSYNPAGAQRMNNKIGRNSIRIPFGTFEVDFENKKIMRMA